MIQPLPDQESISTSFIPSPKAIQSFNSYSRDASKCFNASPFETFLFITSKQANAE